MTQVECPFCSNPDFLAAATRGRATKIEVRLPFYTRQEKFWRSELREYNKTVTTDVEKRGEYLHTSFYGDDFEERWRDFTVEVFGIESAGEIIYPRKSEMAWDSPPTPFLFVESVIQGPNQDPLIRQFFACRITHKQTTAVLIAHWWPSHGRRLEIYSELDVMTPGSSIDAATAGLEFFKRETRGAPKITERGLVKAIQTLGKDATLTSVAKELDVTRQALQFWARRGGMESWEKVKKRYSTAQA